MLEANRAILLDLLEKQKLTVSTFCIKQNKLDIHNRYIHMMIAQFDDLFKTVKKNLNNLDIEIEDVYCYTMLLLEMVSCADQGLSVPCQNLLQFLENETACLCDDAVVIIKPSLYMFSQSDILNFITSIDQILAKYEQCLHHQSLANRLLILQILGRLCRALIFRDLYLGIVKHVLL